MAPISRPRILRIASYGRLSMRRPAEADLAAGDAARRIDEADDRRAGQRLSGARLADDAQHLARRDLERDVVDRAQRAVARRKLDAQARDREQRRRAAEPPPPTSSAIRRRGCVGRRIRAAGDVLDVVDDRLPIRLIGVLVLRVDVIALARLARRASGHVQPPPPRPARVRCRRRARRACVPGLDLDRTRSRQRALVVDHAR